MSDPAPRPQLRLVAREAASSPHQAPTVAVPRVPIDAFPRPRLLARLDADWDIAVLHGPAGSGKSTLVAQWARGGATAVHWRAAAELAAELSEQPDLDQRLAELLAEAPAGVTVVDGAEVLDADTIAVLGRAFDRTSDTRLVVTTRSRWVLEELGIASDAAMVIIGPDELKVDDEELAVAAPALSEPRRVELRSDSGALVLGIRAMLADDGGDRLRIRALRQLREAAARRPAGYLDALARLGLFRAVDAAVARRIGVAPAWLALAEEDGLGWLEDGWLGITPFAAEAIAPLVEAIPAAERDALRRDVLHAELHLTKPVELLRLALALGEYDRASDVLVHHGYFYFTDAQGVRRAFAGIDAAGLSRYPLLLTLLAQMSMIEASTRFRGVRLFGQAITALTLRSKEVSPRDGAILRAIAATLLRFTPIADRAFAQVRKSDAELRALGLDKELRLGMTGAQLLTHYGLTSLAAGRETIAAAQFEEAYGQLRELGRAEQVDPMTLHAALLALRGELPLARELVTRADELEWPEGWHRGPTAQAINLARAILALESGDVELVVQHLEADGPIAGLLEHWPLFGVVQAWRDALVGDYLVGRARLQEIRRSRRGKAFTTSALQARMDAADSLLALMAGDLADARHLARAALTIPQGRIALARVQLATGRDAEAAASLQRLAGTELAVRERIEADSLRALVALRAGDRQDLDPLIGRIAAAVARTGLLAPLVGLADADRDLLIDSAERAGSTGLVSALERARPRRPFDAAQAPNLSKRERMVLEHLAEAPSTAELAVALHVSVNTVKTQLRSVYRKLGVTTREQAIARAVALGLARADPE